MRDKIFYTLCFGFLFGVLLRSFVFVNLYLTILFGAISFALFLFSKFVSKNNWGIIASVFLLAFCFGIFRFHTVDLFASNSAGILADKVGQKVSLSGEIVDEPSIKQNNQQLTVLIKPNQSDTNSAIAESVSSKILISVDLDQDYKYGDKINFTGTLKKPENFMTDQGKEFDYANYLRKDGIFYVMSYPKIAMVIQFKASCFPPKKNF
jgi:hypothetical protein